MTTRIDVRLLPHERALIDTLAQQMATKLRPTVSLSDVVRAGLVALSDRLASHSPEMA